MQAGSLVGLMSHTALGQFDAGLPALDHDRRYLIVPNVEAFAAEHALDARQVRLWAATREVVHHGILGVPWLRGRLVSLVADYFADMHLDPGSLTERLSQLQDPAQLQEIMGEGTGLPALLGGETDPAKHDRIASLLLFLEGFGVWATRRALHDLVPDLSAIERAADGDGEPTPAEEALLQLADLRVERSRVPLAASFVDAVERRWGTDAVASLWDDAEHPPLLSELDDPVGWAARVLLEDEAGMLEDLFGDEDPDTGTDDTAG
jgi:putative hydrolase